LADFPLLKDTSGYLAVKMVMKNLKITLKSSFLGLKKQKKDIRYAVIEIPKTINRFVVTFKWQINNILFFWMM
jgi:polyphosphate kinase